MGAFLSQPVTTKSSEDGKCDALMYGVSAMQGWRISMEDAHNCLTDIGDSKTSMFGVYDGHGGSEVAEYCAKYLADRITKQESFKNGDLEKCLYDAFLAIDKEIASEEGIAELKMIAGDSNEDDEGDEDEAALLQEEANLPIELLLKRLEENAKNRKKGSSSKDNDVDDDSESDGDNNEEAADGKEAKVKLVNGSSEAIANGHCGKDDSGDSKEQVKEEKNEDNDDDDASSENEDEDDSDDDDDEDDAEEEDDVTIPQSDECGMDSGTTANVALIRDSKLIVANAGDSRCVLCRAGKAIDMSTDHKPEDEEEKKRILLAGGRVSADGRVNGGLNLSRALGDHSYKQEKNLSPGQQAISPVPDTKVIDLCKDDEFMVLACDGIWNVKESQEVIDFVKERLQKDQENEDENLKLSKICEELMDACMAPDSSGDGSGCDNMTCIIVKLNRTRNVKDGKNAKRQMDNESTPASKKLKTN